MTTLNSLRTLTGEQVAAYHREGYHITRQLFSKDEVAHIRDEFMTATADGPIPRLSEARRGGVAYDPTDPLARYPRVMNPHRFPEHPLGPLSKNILLDERLENILADLFADDPIAAQTMFYFKPPGARGQDFHQDNFYLRVKPGNCLAAWIAVDDCDEENGCMSVVPTSNKLDIACPERADSKLFFTSEHVAIPAGIEPQPVILKAGDVLFFNGSIIHGSFPNTSPTRFRRAFICHYVPGACIEVSDFYKPLLRFSGEPIEKSTATGGGPCGNIQQLATAPH